MAATVATDLLIHRLDVDTYHRLVEAGALEGMDVELLDGLLIDREGDREDRGRKAVLYSDAGIPTYWLVDVPGRTVEVRTGPGSDNYAHCEIYREGSVVPSPLDGVDDLAIAALLADVEA